MRAFAFFSMLFGVSCFLHGGDKFPAEVFVYPVPQSVDLAGGAMVSVPGKLSLPEDLDESVAKVLREAFPEKSWLGSIFSDTFTVSIVPDSGSLKKVSGAYRLTVDAVSAKIEAFDVAGQFYAAQTLSQMVRNGKIQPCVISDYPDIAFRGTVEGFYGRPWGTSGRLSQFKFYGKYKMNTYIYGPKDDPYHHGKWREPYPEKETADFKELLSVAKENHVNFYWAIHLGTAFNDKSKKEENFKALFAKLDAMYAMGFRAFAAFFDDFGGQDAELHAEICNAIRNEFLVKKGDCAPLIMCPNAYAGDGQGVYCRTIGEKLEKDIHIMWTGRGICSDIKADICASVTKGYRRPPFVWWNWPVNDYCRKKVLMGRTYGLDVTTYAGFVSNPMENCEASKIALFGVADFSWNMKGFNSDVSWKDGIKRLYPKFHEDMQVFANHNSDQSENGHGYRREESVEFQPIAEAALLNYKKTGKMTSDEVIALQKEFSRIQEAGDSLIFELTKNDKPLLFEIEFWVRTFAEQGKLGTLATCILTADNAVDKVELFKNVMKSKQKLVEFSDAHAEHFKAHTFPNDKRFCRDCKTATKVVQPLINEILSTEWGKLYVAMTGRKIGQGTSAYRTISNVGRLQNIAANRSGIYVNFGRVMEQITVKPGEFFGLVLPDGVSANYIHAKLDNASAVNSGTIEVSKNAGKTWSKIRTNNHGQEMETSLNIGEKYNAARYVNTSKKPVSLKINMFKLDVPGDSRANLVASMTDGNLDTVFILGGGKTVTLKNAKKKKLDKKDVHVFADVNSYEVSVDNKTFDVLIKAASDSDVKIFEVLF